MHDLNNLHDSIAKQHRAKGEPEDEDNTISKQISEGHPGPEAFEMAKKWHSKGIL